MKNNICINIFLSIGVGFLFAQLQLFCGNRFLFDFLKSNLITLLIALIAINSATLSIVLTKIRELMDKKGTGNFSATKNQMILSIQEQIILIIVAIVLFIILDSTFIKNHEEYKILAETLLIGTFIYALRILYDTAKSVFVILDY
ncbi:hypothetical protein [Sulfurospirillum cavolei]|uniref:hypothetical protein n=1 Tax=Sulfurospirillum cavolei TaxID=366522 RepID=UPI003FA1F5E1